MSQISPFQQSSGAESLEEFHNGHSALAHNAGEGHLRAPAPNIAMHLSKHGGTWFLHHHPLKAVTGHSFASMAGTRDQFKFR